MSNRRASKHLISLSSLFLRNGRELQTLEHCKPFSTFLSHSIASQGKDTHQPNSSICKDFLFTRRYITSHERNALPALKAYERGVSSSAIRNAKDLTDSAVPSPLTQVPNLPTEKTTDGSDAEAEADNEEKKPSNVIVQAVLKKIKQGPKKVNLVAALVRGMLVEDALLQMQVLVKRAALAVYKTIKSARANAVHNNGLNPDRLIIVEAFVGKGRYLKRIWPHAKGRHGIRKRKSCMLTVKVREMTPEEEEHRALIQTNCFKKLSKTQRRLVPHQLIETQWQWHRKPKRSPSPTSQAN